MIAASYLRTSSLELRHQKINKHAIRKRLRTLNGKYAPLYTFSAMRAIFEQEALEQGGQIGHSRLAWQLDVPGVGTVLRFVRVDARTWQQENLSGW